MSDEELLRCCREGNTDAEEMLLIRYTNVVKREVRFLFLYGGETEDLMQEAMIGLVKAMHEYQPGKGSTFHTFATECIRNKVKTAIRDAGRLKHMPLNVYVSLDADESDMETFSLVEKLPAPEDTEPEKALLSKEAVEELKKRMDRELSSMEKKVVELYLLGFSCREIAERLDRPEQSVHNALARVRAKLRA